RWRDTLRHRRRVPQGAQFLALAREVRWHLLEHVLEHRERVERRAAGKRAERLRFLPAGGDVRLELLLELGMALLGPFAEGDQVLLEAADRIPEGPRAPLLLRTVAGGIIAGGMRRGAVGHVFVEGRAAALARALSRPLRHRVHGEEIVAVDTHAGNTVAGAALRKGPLLPAGESLEGGDRPLVVDQVQDHRRPV